MYDRNDCWWMLPLLFGCNDCNENDRYYDYNNYYCDRNPHHGKDYCCDRKPHHDHHDHHDHHGDHGDHGKGRKDEGWCKSRNYGCDRDYCWDKACEYYKKCRCERDSSYDKDWRCDCHCNCHSDYKKDNRYDDKRNYYEKDRY